MDGLTGGRAVGRLVRLWTAGGIAILLSVGPTARPSVGQVGHDPAQSPYRDIVLGSGPVVFAGYLGGDRGRGSVGPSNALSLGIRYELPAGRSLVMQFSTAFLQGDRFIVDPSADSAAPARRTGPFDSDLLLTEIGMQLRLTGAKTWRGLSPYVGTGLGMAFDLDSPGDTTGSGYAFRSKITLSGAVGVRWHTARHIAVQADLRGLLWRLRYPISFHSAAADGSRVVPLEHRLNDWTLHSWISLGVGWTF